MPTPPAQPDWIKAASNIALPESPFLQEFRGKPWPPAQLIQEQKVAEVTNRLLGNPTPAKGSIPFRPQVHLHDIRSEKAKREYDLHTLKLTPPFSS